MIKVVGKENCSNCEEAVRVLKENGISFEHILINELSQEEQNKYIEIAKNNKITAFPLLFKKNQIIKNINDLLLLHVEKRNGKLVSYDRYKIIDAIEKAMFELSENDLQLENSILDAIENEINNKLLVSVEEIQDIVEFNLKKYNQKLYKRYSEYRNKKQKERVIKSKLNEYKPKLLSEDFISKYKHIKNPMTPLGTFVYYRTYSRWIEELNRREYWWETVQRIVEYNCSLLPTTTEEAEALYDNIFNLVQLPSGRSLWIAGTKSAEDFPLANYNCSFVVIDKFDKFGQLFHALLVGAGCGFRVLFEDVAKLPPVRNNIDLIHKEYNGVNKKSRNEYTTLKFRKNKVEIIIGDSKIGWIKALDFFLEVISSKDYKYIDTIIINYDHVRPLGEKLKTFGGHASGHKSMQNMITKIYDIISNRVKNGENQLRTIDCMDIANNIALNVVVGGTRRSAEICLFDANDEEIIKAKSNMYYQDKEGNWVENQDILHRRMSNNSILYYSKPTRERLHWNIEQMRFTGEPAFVNMESALKRNPNAKGLNPCAEVLLDDQQSCNLTVVNMMAFVNPDGTYNKDELFKAQKLSARVCYRMTNVDIEMHEWKSVQHRDRLLGCDLTGQQDFRNATGISYKEYKQLMRDLRQCAREAMQEIAKENNMNESLLVTAGKPNGTLALLPTVSAGCHYSHSPYYIRRIRISSQDPLCKVVEELGYPIFPETGQSLENCDTKVIEFPVKSPNGKTKYDISAIEQLEYYKMMMENYVEMNQSITVTVRNDEWDAVEQWLWDNWDTMVAVSFLSLDDNYYPLMPYESCSEDEYNKRLSTMKQFNPNLISKYEKMEFEAEGIDDAECKTGCGVR